MFQCFVPATISQFCHLDEQVCDLDSRLVRYSDPHCILVYLYYHPDFHTFRVTNAALGNITFKFIQNIIHNLQFF